MNTIELAGETEKNNMKMSVTRNLNGSYTVAETIKAHRVARTYYFYTRAEAVRRFRSDTKQQRRAA